MNNIHIIEVAFTVMCYKYSWLERYAWVLGWTFYRRYCKEITMDKHLQDQGVTNAWRMERH